MIQTMPICDIPEGSRGQWTVEKFTVSEEDAEIWNIRQSIQMMHGRGGRHINPGKYTRLMKNRLVVMSNTPAEVEDLISLIYSVTGNCLIAGLGLGITVEYALQKKEVENVTVVEIDEDIISLVGSHLKDKYNDRLNIIHADILNWKLPRGQKWNTAWFDIWDDICVDNLQDFTRLKRKFARRISGWKGFWAEREHYRLKRFGW